MTEPTGQALRLREAAVHRAEQEMRRSEERAMAECAQLTSAAGALLARLQTARAATTHLAAAGLETDDLAALQARVQGATLPALDSHDAYSQVLTVREEALEARGRVLEALRQQLHLFGSALSRLTSQLTADEQMLHDWESRVSGGSATSVVMRPQGRRDRLRVRMQVPVTIERDGAVFQGASADLSQEGAFIAVAEPPSPRSSPVTLRFCLPDGPAVVVSAEVRWTRSQHEKTPEIFPGAGVRFVDVSSDVASALAAYVQSRAGRFFAG